jgi:hypothetical protein
VQRAPRGSLKGTIRRDVEAESGYVSQEVVEKAVEVSYAAGRDSIVEVRLEAFIICRNFDPSVLPLPPTFSSEALDNLAKQTSGTLTLESLATLVPSGTESSPAWEILKGYVGGGDLK